MATSDTAYVAEMETVWPGRATGAEGIAAWIEGVESDSSQTGISLTVEPTPGGTRFIWSLPLIGGRP